ncbi:hypothetical protein [Zavarzinella formosa]|uniref:hypothetical protein n=1 Tax=Zavarzinella formosa TaxID=360055 RepID=UPI0003777936|nr:hypothetical protein [Zavarzinella formosa]
MIFLNFNLAFARTIAILAAVSFPPIITVGQEVPPKTPSSKTTEGWKEIRNDAGNFAAEFPGRAGASVGRSGAGVVNSVNAFHQDKKGTQYSVGCQLYLGDRTEAQLIEQVGGKVYAKMATEKKEIKIGNHPGIEFSAVKTADGAEKTVRGRVFAVKNMMFHVTVTSNPDVVVPEDDIVRFFNSFRLLDEEAKATVAVPKAVAPKKTDPMPKEEPVVKLPVVDEKYVPGKSLFDPKMAAAERAMIPQMRSLPQPSERRVECLGVLKTPFNPQAYGWSPDGRRFAVSGINELWVVDVATGRAMLTMPGFGETGFRAGAGLRFSPDGKKLLCHNREAIRVIDVETGEIIRDVPTPGPTMEAVLSEDGSTLSATLTSKTGFGMSFASWNTKDWTRKHISFPENQNCGWCFTSNGNHLIVATRKFGQNDKPNPPVEAWNLLNGHRSILPVKLPVLHLAMNTDHRTLLVTTAWSPDNQCEYHAVDVTTGEDRKLFKGQSPGGAGRLTPDGKYLLADTPVLGQTVVTRLLDAATGKELWSQEYGNCTNYLMSPGGAFLVRTPYLLADYEVDVLAVDDMANPKFAELAGAMDKARAAGFYINPYGNHLRAKAYSSRFNGESLRELTKTLPQTTIVEFRDLFYQSENILKSLPELAKLPGLEQLEFRQNLDGDPAARKPLGDCKNLKRLEISDGDTGLEHLKDCPKLEELTVRAHKDLTDAGLKKIFAIKSLRQLKIDGINLKVTNAGYAGIGQLTELRSISTRGGAGRVSGEVFAHWKKCPKLECVELLDAEMTDADAAVLATMPQLTEIRLNPQFTSEPKFTDAGVASLAPLKNLKTLSIQTSNKLTAKGLKSLDLSKLEMGWFGGIQFADEDMPMLKSMTSLRELWISHGSYTDEGLDTFKQMNHLHRLCIANRPGITEAKIKELHKALPKTVISRTF